MSHTAHPRITLLASASLALCLSYAHAASPNVDAGSLLRQAEQDLKPAKAAKKRAPRKAAPTAAAQTTEATVQVKAFAFKGNTLLSSDALQTALTSFTNRALTLAQLKEAADAITNTYREAGWTVRAYLPKQEINNGVVTLQIVEAVFGNARVQTTSLERIEASRLVNMAQALLTQGQPIHANDIDRALLLLDDLPGISVSGNLAEGQHDGETDLAIFAADDALLTGNASIDNQGSRATGTNRLSVNLNLNSPARMGDLLSTNFLQTRDSSYGRGSTYARGSYSLPVGYNGARAGIHTSSLRYKVLESYDASASGTYGTADTTGFDASYPLLRSQFNNVNLTWSYDEKKLENFAGEILNSSYKIKASNVSLSTNHSDNWGRGGFTSTSATITQGNLNNDGSPNAVADAQGAHVAGTYSKFNISINRLQALTTDVSFYASLSAQVADKNLDSSERMYLGGATGVRAFPASEAGGAAGHAITLELRKRLDNNFTLTSFYDVGHITVNQHNAKAIDSSAVLTHLNAYDLKGYGASVAWQDSKNIEFKTTLARRIASNPNADVLGMDSDKTKHTLRLWISAGIGF